MSSKITLRPSHERGHADHEWLKTYHTFSFASYYDDAMPGYGPLRVVNEDRVLQGNEFGLHGHREFEIFSYVVSGELEHSDSMGNTEILRRGDIQSTTAGTGIRHSEGNKRGKETVHFLQIWAQPNESRLAPHYYTRHFKEEEKRGKLVKVVSSTKDSEVNDTREGSGPTPVHADITMYATLLPPSQSVSYTYTNSPSITKGYIQLISSSGYRTPSTPPPQGGAKLSVSIGGGKAVELQEGDGLFIELKGDDRELKIESLGDREAEAIVFEM